MYDPNASVVPEILSDFKVGFGLRGEGAFYVYDNIKYHHKSTAQGRKKCISFTCAHKVVDTNGTLKKCNKVLEQILLGSEWVIRPRTDAPHMHPDLQGFPLAEVSHFREALREQATRSAMANVGIYRDLAEKYPDESMYYSFHQARTMMYRAKKNNYPPVPKTLSDLGDFLANDGYQRFGTVPGDMNDAKGEGQERSPFYRDKLTTTHVKKTNTSLVFSDKVFVDEFMRTSGPVDLFIDATFKICPRKPKTYQMMSIHAHRAGKVHPLVFVMMEGKTEKDYHAVLNYVLEELIPNLSVSLVMSDYETALINAVKRVFRGIRVTGCHFHYCQAIWKYAKKLGILEVEDFVENILHLLLVLPYLAPEDMVGGFEDVKKVAMKHPQIKHNDKIAHYFSYMYKTWYSTSAKRHVVSVWNKIHRTNNFLEAFHSNILCALGRTHPSVWAFLEILVKVGVTDCRRRYAASDFKKNLNLTKAEFLVTAETLLESRAIRPFDFLGMIKDAVKYVVVVMKLDLMERVDEDEELKSSKGGKTRKLRAEFQAARKRGFVLTCNDGEEPLDDFTPHSALVALENTRRQLAIKYGDVDMKPHGLADFAFVDVDDKRLVSETGDPMDDILHREQTDPVWNGLYGDAEMKPDNLADFAFVDVDNKRLVSETGDPMDDILHREQSDPSWNDLYVEEDSDDEGLDVEQWDAGELDREIGDSLVLDNAEGANANVGVKTGTDNTEDAKGILGDEVLKHVSTRPADHAEGSSKDTLDSPARESLRESIHTTVGDDSSESSEASSLKRRGDSISSEETPLDSTQKCDFRFSRVSPPKKSTPMSPLRKHRKLSLFSESQLGQRSGDGTHNEGGDS